MLNFGHTIGHGIESYFKGKYYHGECVGLGMLYLSSENVKEANKVVDCVIKTYKDITYHDLRITNGEQNINVIFDLVIPHRYDNEQIKDIINNVKNSIKSINNKYSVVIKIDRPFI